MYTTWECPILPGRNVFKPELETAPAFQSRAINFNNYLQRKVKFHHYFGQMGGSYISRDTSVITPDLSGLGKKRGHFTIAGETSAHRHCAVGSEQTACFVQLHSREMAPIQTHKQARKQDYLITWKCRPATAAVGGTCHSWLAKDPGPDVSQSDTWTSGQPVRSHPLNSGACTVQYLRIKEVTLYKNNPSNRKQTGKGRGMGIQFDNHVLVVESILMLFSGDPNAFETFPSLVYLKKFF
jgi:hypothetical protein